MSDTFIAENMSKFDFYKKVILWASRYPVSGSKKFHVLFDYLKLFKQKGLSMEEYSDYEFEHCSEDFRKSFLGLNEQRYYLDYLNPIKYYALSRNKYLAHRILDETGIRKTTLYCYYNPEAKFIKSSLNANSVETVIDILKGKDVKSCVVKETEGSHGDGVQVVKEIVYGDKDAEFVLFNGERKKLSAILKDHPLIFESILTQSRFFADFNPSSVNTIRCMTTLYPNGEARLIAVFLRIGRKGKIVDNAGSGGNDDACVNVETGEITHVIQFNGYHNFKEISEHPDSGASIEGLKIENWESIKEEVCRFQQSFPYCKAAGWDVAITDEGPTVIEVNDMWDQIGQLFIQHGWRKEIRDCYKAWKATGVIYYLDRRNNELTKAHLKKIASYE